MRIVNNFLFAVPIAILYFGLIFEKTFINKILCSKFFTLSGRGSYAFYLLHMPVISFIGTAFLKKYFGANYNLYVMVIFVITLVLSILLFLFMEEPFNKLIRKSFSKMRTS
jgi:peptidoglycan/LPS O-acetylase OafA/YrhL